MITHVLKRIIDPIFSEIDEVEKIPDLFIPRDSDCSLLETKLAFALKNNGNILVIGDRGVGKSTFLKWFILNSEFLKKLGSINGFIDLREESEDIEKQNFIHELKLSILDKLIGYFKDNEIETDFIDDNWESLDSVKLAALYRRCIKIFKNGKKISRKIILFIDDLDYVFKGFFGDLIQLLKPFLVSANCVIVLAARKPAYNLIMTHTDYVASRMFKNTNSLMRLHQLSIRKVIMNRIKFSSSPSISELASNLTDYSKYVKSESYIEQILNSHLLPLLGKEESEYFPIPYPFTRRQEMFIAYMSNGNISWAYEIANRIAHFIVDNHQKLEKENDSYYIKTDDLLTIFLKEDVPGNIKIQNLNSISSYSFVPKKILQDKNIPDWKIENSLLILVLEQLTKTNNIEEQSMLRIKEYGFEASEIKRAVETLFEMFMIEEITLRDRKAIGIEDDVKKYGLTNRGDYYLKYVTHWDEYIELFGISKHLLVGNYPEFHNIIINELLIFLISLKRFWQTENGHNEFRVSKTLFISLFNKSFKDVLITINIKSKSEPFDITEEMITKYLLPESGLGVIKKHEVEKNNKYLVSITEIEKQRIKKSIPDEIPYNFELSELKEFVKTHLSAPLSYKQL